MKKDILLSSNKRNNQRLMESSKIIGSKLMATVPESSDPSKLLDQVGTGGFNQACRNKYFKQSRLVEFSKTN